MCRPETRQSYFVLKAFNEAGKPLYRDELEGKISEVLQVHGFNKIEQLGFQSLKGILNKFAQNEIIAPDDQKRLKLTDTGKQLEHLLEGFIKKQPH